jgi:DNA-binding CsgD family transcriptional regulator
VLARASALLPPPPPPSGARTSPAPGRGTARDSSDGGSAELAATGETARRRDATTVDELTPQELQIALLLAEGKTTREAAVAVFLSPKTVEYHLRHVYLKLGIRSRHELAAAFSS